VLRRFVALYGKTGYNSGQEEEDHSPDRLIICRGGRTMDYSSTYRLAQDIRDSDEYKTYHELKESVMSDETTAALVREYRKLQMTIQMTAMSGKTADNEDMQRFSGISTLLFSKPEVSRFLLSEMQLQQALSDIFKIVTEAADLDITMPGIEG
jgi:cell fate (sporulation/competence/biofilm development) regulator YlbF (YheA/YmcA/DUF963 family)